MFDSKRPISQRRIWAPLSRWKSPCVALGVAFVLAGCPRSGDSSPDGGRQDGGNLITVTPPKKVTLPQLPALPLVASLLPKLPDGNLLLVEAKQARIDIDPTAVDAITAVGTCTDSITYCVAPGERTLADCVFSVPACITNTPWLEPRACCPAACKQGFESLRTQGVEPLIAFEKTFFLEPDCFPGVRAALEGR